MNDEKLSAVEVCEEGHAPERKQDDTESGSRKQPPKTPERSFGGSPRMTTKNEKPSAVPVCENSLGAKNQKFDAATVWKQMEDLATPGLQLTVFERAVYYHLMRHSQLEGKARLRFSIKAVARGACLSDFAVRKAARADGQRSAAAFRAKQERA